MEPQGDVRQSATAEFEAYYREMAPAVHRYVARSRGHDEAEDVVGRTFEIAWRQWEHLPIDAPARKAWAYRTARNLMSNALRAEISRRRLVERIGSFSLSIPDPATEVAGADRVTWLMGSLVKTEREILELVVWMGMTPTEASRVLGCSITAATSRMNRARKRLKDRLEMEERRGRLRSDPEEMS